MLRLGGAKRKLRQMSWSFESLRYGKKYKHPIFIVGAPRSGTTLLNLHLAQRAAHKYVPECNSITHIFHALNKVPYLGAHRLNAYYGDFDQALVQYRRIISILIDQLLHKKRKKKYVVLKDPYLTLSMHHLLEVFPDAYVFMMYRHPYYTLASKDAIDKNGSSTLDSYKIFYTEMAKNASRWGRHPNFHVIYYDSLIHTPDKIFAQISQLLGYKVDNVEDYPDELRGSAFSTDKTFRSVHEVSESVNVTQPPHDSEIESIYGNEIKYFESRRAHFQKHLKDASCRTEGRVRWFGKVSRGIRKVCRV